MLKGFMLWVVIAYSSGPTGGTAIVIETREFSKAAQCEQAAAIATERASKTFNRVVAWCTPRDIVTEELK